MATVVAGPVRVPVEADLSGFDGDLSAAQQKLRDLGPASTDARVAIGALEKTIGQTSTAAVAAQTALQRSGQGATVAATAARDLAGEHGRLAQELRQTDAALQRLNRLYDNATTDASRARVERLTGAYLNQRSALRGSIRGLQAQQNASSSATNASFILANTIQDVSAANGDLGNIARFAGNNVLQLTQVMGQMSVQAKAAGSTLSRTLVAGLSGPGGVVAAIGLAVGILPTLIQQLTKTEDAFGRSGQTAKDAADDYRTAIDAAIDLSVANDAALASLEARLSAEAAAASLGPARSLDDILSGGTTGDDPFAAFRQGAEATTFEVERLTTARDASARMAIDGAQATGAEAEAIRALQSAIADETSERERSNAVEALRLRLGIASRQESERAARAARDRPARGGRASGESTREVDRIAASLASARREATGLQALGEIDIFAATADDIQATEQALRAVLRLAEGTPGRAEFLGDIQGQLADLRATEQQLARTRNVARLLALEFSSNGPVNRGLAEIPRRALDAADALQDVTLPRDVAGRVRQATTELDGLAGVLQRNGREAQRLVDILTSDVSGGIVDAFLFGAAGQRDAELAGFDAEREREALQEAFRAGEISAEEYNLRLEAIDANLRRIRSEAPTIGNALRNAFRNAGLELTELLIRAAAFRAILAGLDLFTGGSASALLGAGGSLFSPVTAAAPAAAVPQIAAAAQRTRAVPTVGFGRPSNVSVGPTGSITIQIPAYAVGESQVRFVQDQQASGAGLPTVGGVVA
ncbi:MAG: hypothetical protein AAF170_15765 [Bacteroidota bacterium]